MSSTLKPINIAVLAMGGQGGGVLSDWIVDLAERHGYLAQTTSVPGVAQRTGATIYYVELFPEEAVRKAGREPVLALMPVPGDVDVVIAAELMEAGRAVTRGFVTKDRTTVIASTHRDYAIGEKMALGDGLLDHNKVIEAGEEAAKKFVYFDMQALADKHHSVISATLFGALAGSGALPFSREAFEESIRRGGVGVEPSLKAFAAALERAQEKPERPVDPKLAQRAAAQPPAPRHRKVAALIERVQALPDAARFNATEGVRRLIDYQDPAYAGLYLDRLEAILERDRQYGGDAHGFEITAETARYLALWMSYEDTIRVADLKTRSGRFKRFSDEVGASADQIVYVTEFMHPRVEEICDTLPRPLGQWVLESPKVRGLIGRFTHEGRFIRTATLRGFSLLYVLSRLRRIRRSTLRYGIEQGRIEGWLEKAKALVAEDYALALEVVRLQRLVKGYGDTWERGLRNFETIMGTVERVRGLEDAATTVRRLRDAALADDKGAALQKALAEIDRPREPQPAATA
jgi:indolepyruvate ferredoxin oxidoreductase beta subunit